MFSLALLRFNSVSVARRSAERNSNKNRGGLFDIACVLKIQSRILMGFIQAIHKQYLASLQSSNIVVRSSLLTASYQSKCWAGRCNTHSLSSLLSSLVLCSAVLCRAAELGSGGTIYHSVALGALQNMIALLAVLALCTLMTVTRVILHTTPPSQYS